MKFKQWAIIGLVLLFGIFLKIHNYDIYPQRGATSDEYTYSFLGVSLLTKGIPISWSHFSGYKNREDLSIKGIYFPIVWPYFDHPPLNGLVVGWWSLLWGGNTFETIQLSVIRIVPIVLSTVSSLLIYLIARRRYGFQVGLWALLIYTTSTVMAIQGRVVLAENLLTPLLLSAIYLYDQKKRQTPMVAIALGIVSGLSLWTKEVGISVFLMLLALMIMDRTRIWHMATFIFVVMLFILGYVTYGMYYNSGIFWNIVTTQATREVGPKTLIYLLTTPIIINKIYYDGWYFLGFLSLFAGLLQAERLKVILVAAFTYFLLLLVLLTVGGEIGWYLIPLFPFMAIATSLLLVDSLKTDNWYVFALLLFVGFYLIEQIYQKNFGLTVGQFRLLTGVLFAPFIWATLLKKKNAFQDLGSLYFYSFIAGSAYLTYMYVHPA
ncbi:MAG: hypothetical protein UU42_C0010G0019 [Candidatus Woesebacteria bacterium GW2011_GWA1_41_13b]|uniref:Glycosyltransferase RgtA/B/C/D-like domain-containing protein n=1 Tax=Candidatus Woesebacteria bacterium GW2011_GWA1_41_13b TaxID=1618555 RepID=A0A0G0URX5_9BACT|nr:MAG: hypothetical protein UU42_C0010G0019 [Candidatus Woesebacteria bacterium GW2011_GWA1_41_13b]